MTITVNPRLDPLSVFDAALSRAEAGIPVTLTLHGQHGTNRQMDPATWCHQQLPGDRNLLARCGGPTLDVGCGPGRLTSAISRLGHPALGIDISATAVRLTRARGALALRRDVFAALPGHPRWHHLLLADGNIGIGGDPIRLLNRCHDLLAPGGSLHLELAPPGTGSWSGNVRLSADDGPVSQPFPWAMVAADALPELAATTASRIVHTWTEAGRWFATLSRI